MTATTSTASEAQIVDGGKGGAGASGGAEGAGSEAPRACPYQAVIQELDRILPADTVARIRADMARPPVKLPFQGTFGRTPQADSAAPEPNRGSAQWVRTFPFG